MNVEISNPYVKTSFKKQAVVCAKMQTTACPFRICGEVCGRTKQICNSEFRGSLAWNDETETKIPCRTIERHLGKGLFWALCRQGFRLLSRSRRRCEVAYLSVDARRCRKEVIE